MIRSITLIFFLCPALTGFSQNQSIWVKPPPVKITTHFLNTGKYQSQQLIRIINNSKSLVFYLSSGISLADNIPDDFDPDHRYKLDFHLEGMFKHSKSIWIHPEKGYFEELKPLMDEILHK